MQLVGRESDAAKAGHGVEGNQMAQRRALGECHELILGIRGVDVKTLNCTFGATLLNLVFTSMHSETRIAEGGADEVYGADRQCTGGKVRRREGWAPAERTWGDAVDEMPPRVSP